MFSLWRILTGWLVLELVMIVILILPCGKSGQTMFRKILAYHPFSGFTAYVDAFYVVISFVVTMLLYATSDVWTAHSVVIKKVDSNEVKLNYEYLAACLSAVLCFLICIIISINVKLIQLKKKREKLMRMLAEKALEVEDFSKMADYHLIELRTFKAAYDQKRDEVCALKAKISETKSKCEDLVSSAVQAATDGGEQEINITSVKLSECETLASLASTKVAAASVGEEQEENITSDILSKCETLASLAATKTAATVGGEAKKIIISSEIKSQCEILTDPTAATNGGDIKESMCETLAGLSATKVAAVDGDQEKNNIHSV